MHTLIHNTVKTDRGDYTFNTREEAEAFFIAVWLRANKHRQSGSDEKAADAKQARIPAKPARRANVRQAS
ncbi:MAG: hypothetical protein JWR07_5506 [Nevskia sp.]|nr:hypothetical protein [Nevskia sp.]